MNKLNIYKSIVSIQLLIGFQISFGQVPKDYLKTDSVVVLSGIANNLDINSTKWFTIGSQYDFLNSTFGLVISNGYDERPLIHFEDFFESFIYKMQVNTDFNKDYSIGTDLAWKYPNRHLSLISFGLTQIDYTQSNFFHRDFLGT